MNEFIKQLRYISLVIVLKCMHTQFNTFFFTVHWWGGWVTEHATYITTLFLTVRTRAHIMYLAEFSFNMVALLFASMKISVMSLMSDFTIFVLPQILALTDPGVRSWNKVL